MCELDCACKKALEAKEIKIRRLLDSLSIDLPSHEFEAVKSEIFRVLDEE